jgi:predicted phage-related endonuclease
MRHPLGKSGDFATRRSFIGGSDARIIMGYDEAALIRLWRGKRGEADPEDLSANLIVQLGTATEDLNRSWFERNTGRQVRDVQRHVRHSAIYWMAATLEGIVEGTEAVFEAKFMLPWSFSEEAAAENYLAQLQHDPHQPSLAVRPETRPIASASDDTSESRSEQVAMGQADDGPLS